MKLTRRDSSRAASPHSPSASPRPASSPISRARRARAAATWSCSISAAATTPSACSCRTPTRSITAGGPTLAVPAGNVLQIGSDSSGKPLGLHPRLTGSGRFQSGPAGDHSAHGLPEFEPVAFPGHRHLVHRRIPRNRRAPVARAATSTRCRAGRSADRLEHVARDAAHAAVADRLRAVDSERRAATRFRVRTRGAEAATRERTATASPRTCRWTGRTSRSSTPRAQARWRRSIASRTSGPTCRRVTYPSNGLRAGPAGGGRRDGQGHRDEGVLGADRRVRHPLGAEHERRRTAPT